jgi:hypothetical protein
VEQEHQVREVLVVLVDYWVASMAQAVVVVQVQQVATEAHQQAVQVELVWTLIHHGQLQPARAYQVITQVAVAVVLMLHQVQVVQAVVVRVQAAHQRQALQTQAVAVAVLRTSAAAQVVQV